MKDMTKKKQKTEEYRTYSKSWKDWSHCSSPDSDQPVLRQSRLYLKAAAQLSMDGQNLELDGKFWKVTSEFTTAFWSV